MKSVVEVDIDVPQARVAALFANPENMTQWMDDVDRYEVISGEPGTPGSIPAGTKDGSQDLRRDRDLQKVTG